MKAITVSSLTDASNLDRQVDDVLSRSGLVCLPCNGKYRILADLSDEDAVMRLLQSKRRTSKSPSLVFISDWSMLDKVTSEIDPLARTLADEFWPGPLTILFDPHDDLLPRRLFKQLKKTKSRVGVRVPADPNLRRIISSFGGPVLVSSANRENKGGETSPAQIRQNFGRGLDLFVDIGDLQPGPSSTVVHVSGGDFQVVRPGAIEEQHLQTVAGG
jgi:L-threonylcarbamoyladenylate synthase